MRPGSLNATIPALSVHQVALLTVRSSTNGTPRPFCSSITRIVKYGFGAGAAGCAQPIAPMIEYTMASLLQADMRSPLPGTSRGCATVVVRLELLRQTHRYRN